MAIPVNQPELHPNTHDEGHPSFLAHHFDGPQQQYEASKLGMWLFLATEVLLFGGLFCGYAVYRANNPDLFAYGSQYLQTGYGATNTVILIVSSMTMAIGVTAAARGRNGLLTLMLVLTFLGGAGFMGIKYVEYKHKLHLNLVWGTRFYEDPHPEEHAAADTMGGEAGDPDVVATGDADTGRIHWMATCRSCHGLAGEGIPGQGKDIRGSDFFETNTDNQLIAFIKIGRMPFDPLNITGIQMPPKGGNPLLNDDDLRDIVAYMRTFEAPTETTSGEAAPGGESEQFLISRSSIPAAAEGPQGLVLEALDSDSEDSGEPGDRGDRGDRGDPPLPSRDPNRPANAHMFFAIYFLMTGRHGIHVLAGMAVMLWLVVKTLGGHFSSAYYTPIDLGGLYWHVVDLIWIFLFPLFYLI